MQPTSEDRFDANFAAQVLLEIAHEQSLDKLLEKLVERVMDRPHIVCAQVWLIDKGDLCATCPRRPVCPDQSRCLHLAAAKAKSILQPGRGFGQFDPRTAREPLGAPPIGSVLTSGQTRAVPDLDQRPVSPLDPDWMRAEGIRGYAINPISYKGEALGTIVSGTREPLEEQLLPWGSLFANHIGAAIANARAFDEIRVTGQRLEQANQRLARELVERKQAEQALRHSEANLNWAQGVAHIGSWHLDLARSQLTWSDEVFRIFGMPRGTALSYETFLGRVYPGDRERVDRAWAAALQGAPYDIEHRILVGDELKWVRERAAVEFDPQRKAVQAVGTVQDITESKRAAAKVPVRISLLYALIAGLWILLSDRLLVNLVSNPAAIGRLSMFKGWFFVAVTTALLYAMLRGQLRRWGKEAAGRMAAEETVREQADLLNLTHDTVVVMDVEGVIKYWNRGAAEQYDWTAEQAVGRVAYDLLKTVFPAPQEHIKAELLRTGGWQGELVHTRKDGTQVVVASRWALQRDEQNAPATILETSNDITERKRAEEALRRLNRELRAVSSCNQVLLRASDEQSLLQEICRIVCEEAGYRVAWAGYAEHDEAKSVRPVAWTGAEEGSLAKLGITWADTDHGRGPSGTAIRTGRASWIEDYATDPRVAPWRENALRHGFRSAIALPLKDEQANSFGSLNIYSTHPNAFTSEEIRLLEELAGDLAFGILALRSRSARQRAEQEVAMLSFALDKGHEAAFLIDDTARFQYVNEEACRVLGYTRAELLGLAIADIDAEFPLDRWPNHWRDLKAQRSRTFESRHRTRDGRLFPVEISANYFEYGSRAYHLLLVRDITERKRAEEALRESETRFRTLLDHAADALFIQDFERGTIVDVNRQACQSLGYTRQELIGTTGIAFHLDSEQAQMESIAQRTAAGESMFDTHWHRRKDGTLFPVEVQTSLVSYGGRRFLLKVARDITDRKRSEDTLRRNEAYLADGQRLAHMGSWAWSPLTLQSLYWSEEMFRIFGLNPQDGVPTAETFWQRTHPEDLDRTREVLLKAAAGNSDYEHDHRIVLPDGTVKHIHAIGHPVLDENGQLAQYVGTAIDVTERKLAEDELRKHRENLEEMVRHRTEQLAEAKARAEAANREKSRFLANMSHELRTPLNAVLGFSRLLKSGPGVTPHQQETLDIIVRSGEHLLNLINNVLDMAKIEAGKMVLEESEVDLHRLLHEMQSLMGVGAVEKGLRFALEIDPDLPWFVAVDAGKLRQVLLNLLGNAIKYTDSGGVKLRARLARTYGTEKAEIRFEVEDSGPGIPQEDCRRIFFPFVQLGDQAPAQAGTGLGLAICKQYVELMGGQIGVASEPGKGSVFYFNVPIRVLPSVAELEEPKHGRISGLAEGQPSYRLLIVEDQPENRLLLRRLLEPLGFELHEATNGQEAVSLFEQWHPDLIWMDIRMPIMDGLEAIRRIRATKAGADTKIIALTAHALEEERRPIMAAGCDDLVRKPFREHELFGALARHLHLKFIYEQAPRQESPQEPELILRPEQLDALPAELLQDLRQAVIELDTARTQVLIQQVTERDASLGRALKTLAAQLDYKRLLKLLETKHSQPGQAL